MNDINTVTISGRLVEPPTTRQTQTGRRAASLRICSRREYQGKVFEKYYTVEKWGEDADMIARIPANEAVVCTGRLDVNSWTDRENRRHNDVIITADAVMVLRSTMPEVQPTQGYGQCQQAPQAYGQPTQQQPQAVNANGQTNPYAPQPGEEMPF